jgi:hypothetical protein
MAWASWNADRSSATVIVPSSMQNEFGQVPEQTSTQPTEEPGVSRRVYPLSVIPGGVYSVEELRAFLESDEVARRSFAEHATRLGDPELLDHLRVAQVTQPTKMYTQLRRANQLYWSSDPVTVEPGETALYHEPSGVMAARARCGNVMVPKVPPGYPRTRSESVRETVTEKTVEVRREHGERPDVPISSPPVIVLPAPAVVAVSPATVPPAILPPIMVPAAAAAAAAAARPPIVIPSPPSPVRVRGWALGGAVSKSKGFPWWGVLAGGLLANLNGGDVSIVNSQRQSQRQQQQQKQKQKQEMDVEIIPEPGTCLLMALGLMAGGLVAKRRWRAGSQ